MPSWGRGGGGGDTPLIRNNLLYTVSVSHSQKDSQSTTKGTEKSNWNDQVLLQHLLFKEEQKFGAFKVAGEVTKGRAL